MKLVTRLFRLTNKMLSKVNMSVLPLGRDLDERLVEDKDERRIATGLAETLSDWFRTQNVFTVRGQFSAEDAHQFYKSYIASPFRTQRGSSRFNNLLCLYAIAKLYEPEVIVDSGTFEGASAWAMLLACPRATVVSFDIDMSHLAERLPGVSYIEQDWTTYPAEHFAGRRTLAYFDDHVDQARRLLEARERGIELAVFDDDFPVTAFASMAHGGFALPKIEFVLDRTLRESSVLTWRAKGKIHEWPIDHAYLDRALAAIRSTDRMPNTSLITGIHQTPYRLVAVNV